MKKIFGHIIRLNTGILPKRVIRLRRINRLLFRMIVFYSTDLGEEMELQPLTPTTLARSQPVDDEPRELKLSVARPRDIPREIMRRVRPRSISGNSDLADGDSQIISPEEISLDPCTVSKEIPLEQGSFPVAFGKRLIKF